jgi:hypothetical protein
MSRYGASYLLRRSFSLCPSPNRRILPPFHPLASGSTSAPCSATSLRPSMSRRERHHARRGERRVAQARRATARDARHTSALVAAGGHLARPGGRRAWVRASHASESEAARRDTPANESARRPHGHRPYTSGSGLSVLPHHNAMKGDAYPLHAERRGSIRNTVG